MNNGGGYDTASIVNPEDGHNKPFHTVGTHLQVNMTSQSRDQHRQKEYQLERKLDRLQGQSELVARRNIILFARNKPLTVLCVASRV